MDIVVFSTKRGLNKWQVLKRFDLMDEKKSLFGVEMFSDNIFLFAKKPMLNIINCSLLELNLYMRFY